MVKEFPKGKEWLLDNSALRVSLDMTFDVPEEIAEQLELWGLNIFETCEYDPTCRRLKMSASTTLTRLLDRLERRNGKLPLLEEALLMIDEHCDIAARQVYDQDNKAWKAISNALKGRVVADDDQYSLGVCLLSRRSSEAECHIYVLPVQDAGDFFFLRSDQYPFSR